APSVATRPSAPPRPAATSSARGRWRCSTAPWPTTTPAPAAASTTPPVPAPPPRSTSARSPTPPPSSPWPRAGACWRAAAGRPRVLQPHAYDQRGVGYPRVVGGRVDIGAVEVQPPARVTATQVNDGSAQRSRVTSLTVTFNRPVTFAGTPGAAFTLVRNSDSA